MALYRCTNCDLIMEERDFVEITFNGSKYSVCPECLAELLNTGYETLTDDEEKEVLKEWSSDDEYKRRKEEGYEYI